MSSGVLGYQLQCWVHQDTAARALSHPLTHCSWFLFRPSECCACLPACYPLVDAIRQLGHLTACCMAHCLPLPATGAQDDEHDGKKKGGD